MANLDDFTQNPNILTSTVLNIFLVDDCVYEAEVLSNTEVSIEQTGFDNWDGGIYLYTIYLQVPGHIYAKFNKKIPELERSIAEKMQLVTRPCKSDAIERVFIVPKLTEDNGWNSDSYSTEVEQLIRELEAQKALMISVATGGPRIQSKNQEYKDKQSKINALLQKMRIKNLNPHNDLWEWYGKWSSGDLPTYQSRRKYISELFQPIIDKAKNFKNTSGTEIFVEPTGWARVDRSIGEVRKRLEEAANEEQFQAVGLLCRETIISLAQMVFDSRIHMSTDGVTPSPTDAKRMLDAYFSYELAGKTNEAARKHAKAALDLANDLTHRRTADFRIAALCAEASSAVINIVAIISGQRDP